MAASTQQASTATVRHPSFQAFDIAAQSPTRKSDVASPSLAEGANLSWANLPSHACSYCGISNASCVVRCNVPNCQRWFCNAQVRLPTICPHTHTHISRGLTFVCVCECMDQTSENCQIATSGSHIVNHLVRSKHKEVILHPEGALGETTLECYNCGSKNIFLLGFIPAAREGVVVLLCREPCLNNNALRESDFDLQDWQPLIENRSLVHWLVGTPTADCVRAARQCTAQQINKIEEIWKTNGTATMDDIDRPGVDAELTRVTLR